MALATSSLGAPGRTATPRASTRDSATSSWRWRSSRVSGPPGHLLPLGRTNTTPSGLTARWVTGLRPGSPPRVWLPPRPRSRLQPHTRSGGGRQPVPKPSYRLVQEIQPGHYHKILQREQTVLAGAALVGSARWPIHFLSVKNHVWRLTTRKASRQTGDRHEACRIVARINSCSSGERVASNSRISSALAEITRGHCAAFCAAIGAEYCFSRDFRLSSTPRGGATVVGRFVTRRLLLAGFSGQGLAVGWFQP